METRDLALRPRLSRRRLAVAASLTIALTGAGPLVAKASPSPRVTLEASRRRLTAGHPVHVSGRVARGGPGQRVRIVNGRGVVVDSARTDASGRYTTTIRPWFGGKFRARWRNRSSAPVRLRVRARIAAGLRRVRLFGTAKVTGRVRPRSTAHAWVRVRRNGVRLFRRRVRLRPGGWLRVRFRVRKPGAYRAVVRFDDARHVPNRRGTRWRRPPLPGLLAGAHRPEVRFLERRLRGLHYRLSGLDKSYDHRTADALRAFHKVQGLPPNNEVNETSWRALADPRRPRPRAARPRRHVEIDQSRQVLYLVRRGRLATILHTSTGRNGATRDGVFEVYRKLAGYSPNRLYYPSYFDGLRAVHGWPDVPPNAASHGCARVPMWTARWIHRRMPVGTQVRVYH